MYANTCTLKILNAILFYCIYNVMHKSYYFIKSLLKKTLNKKLIKNSVFIAQIFPSQFQYFSTKFCVYIPKQ